MAYRLTTETYFASVQERLVNETRVLEHTIDHLPWFRTIMCRAGASHDMLHSGIRFLLPYQHPHTQHSLLIVGNGWSCLSVYLAQIPLPDSPKQKRIWRLLSCTYSDRDPQLSFNLPQHTSGRPLNLHSVVMTDIKPFFSATALQLTYRVFNVHCSALPTNSDLVHVVAKTPVISDHERQFQVYFIHDSHKKRTHLLTLHEREGDWYSSRLENLISHSEFELPSLNVHDLRTVESPLIR